MSSDSEIVSTNTWNNARICYRVLEKNQADLIVSLLGVEAITQFRFIFNGT